ncbi:hypothetical protein VV867_08830 [Pseudomonas sp. JH-2]|uniref:hypothetical protein n=1 Tax=Pseudomonas sp. JH-2 TaxID=3114998 RepID=UPI002E26EB3D|nr:hypothetical protein [Pseudomonas sp. JH-2]
MAGNKYLKNTGGYPEEQAATQTSAGAANANQIIALDANGKIDVSLLPTGIGADTAVLPATEALAAGNYVNIYDSGSGTFSCRKADASGGVAKMAHGFVLAAVSLGASATIYFEGNNNQVTGMSPGNVWLSASAPGTGTATAPTGSGNVQQRLGVATSASSVNVEFSDPIILA